MGGCPDTDIDPFFLGWYNDISCLTIFIQIEAIAIFAVPKLLGDKSPFIHLSYFSTVRKDFFNYVGHLTSKFQPS